MLGQLNFFQKSRVIVIFVLLGMFVTGCEREPICAPPLYSGDPVKPCEEECNRVEDCDDEECRRDCTKRCLKLKKKIEEESCRRASERERERREKEGWP